MDGAWVEDLFSTVGRNTFYLQRLLILFYYVSSQERRVKIEKAKNEAFFSVSISTVRKGIWSTDCLGIKGNSIYSEIGLAYDFSFVMLLDEISRRVQALMIVLVISRKLSN